MNHYSTGRDYEQSGRRRLATTKGLLIRVGEKDYSPFFPRDFRKRERKLSVRRSTVRNNFHGRFLWKSWEDLNTYLNEI